MGPGFDFALRTRLVYEVGAVERLGPLVRELGARRVLFVTDAGLVAAGHAPRAEAHLRRAGCELERFSAVRENPDANDVAACAAAARAFAPDLFLGFGGGSVIDVAKGADMLLTNGGRMQDYRGFGKTKAPLLPLVAVPTTAGTGSEVQSYALIADETTHQKMACGAADAVPRLAVLDPTLTLSMPRFVTACTGLDAIGHAVETAVTKKRNPASELFSRAALRLALRCFARALAAPRDLEARGGMLQAAAFAGLAIEHSMLGAAHSLANPLTARCGLAHGLAVALLLPHVVRFNAEDPAARGAYQELAAAVGLGESGRDAAGSVARLVKALEDCLKAAEVAPDLAAHGVREEQLGLLAEEAGQQWTAAFNPRPVQATDFEGLLRTALHAA